MNDQEFMRDIEKNTNILQAYPNYLNLFAFPFGQPESTFNESQVNLLIKTGFKKVFYSSALSINNFPLAPSLDRITLLSGDNSPKKIKYRLMKTWLLS
jgi:hypothetical protein